MQCFVNAVAKCSDTEQSLTLLTPTEALVQSQDESFNTFCWWTHSVQMNVNLNEQFSYI